MEEDKLIKKKKLYLTKGNKLALASVCNDLGDLYMREGKYELSLNEYKNEARLYEELQKPIFYARANRMIGEICTTLAEFDEALEYQQIHLDTAKRHKNKLEEQRALASIGRTYLTKAISDPENLNSESLTSAHTAFLQSLSICEGLNNITKAELMDMKARLYLNIGVVKEYFGDFNKGEEFMIKSIQICKNHEIYDQLHHGHYTLGLLHLKNEDYKKALTSFNFALEIADRLSDKIPLLCATYSAKADVLIMIGEFSSAKHVLIKAYKLQSPNIGERCSIEQNLKVVAAMCVAEDNLIITPVTDFKKRKELYEKMGDGAAFLKVFDKAIDYYNKMLDCAMACGDSGKQLLPVFVSLAQTYKDNKQYKLAYEYFQKDYEISRHNPEECYKTLLNLASISELLKVPYEDVASYYDRATNEASATNDQKIIGKVISLFIRYQKRMGKDTDATEQQKSLNMMDYESSDSESDDEGSETPDIGKDINIDDLIDDADLSDEEETRPTRKRGRYVRVKKNDKGESQLHSACIKGNLTLVMSLLEQQHPVNVRDYCGWCPIHEACNRGYADIVKVLIDKGAAINDRGGKECSGITPLHDACANGHLEVIEILLDNGASPLAQEDTGETPLDFLKSWREKVHLDPVMQTFYETLVCRMTTVFEKAGRSTTQNINNICEENDAFYVEQPTSTPRRSTRRSPTKSPSVSPKKSSQSSLIGSLRYSVDADVDFNKPSCSGLRRPSTLDEKSYKSKSNSMIRTLSFTSNKDSSDDGDSDSAACNEYKRAIDGLRTRVEPQAKNSPKKGRKPFLSDEEVDNNWLDEDLRINQPKKRKRSSSNKQNVLESSGIQRTNSTNYRHSKSPNVIELSSEKERENEFTSIMNNEFESDDSTNSVSSNTNKRRRSQSSLLESGFSRNKNDIPLNTFNFNTLPVNRVENLSKKIHKRQQKLNSFVNLEQPDSTTQLVAVSEIKNTIIPLLAINVRIENKLWRIPVQSNEVNVLTIEWLAKEAAKRYYKQEGISPSLQLITKEGAILANEDPLSMVFISATQAEEVQSNIVSWNLAPLPERYVESCCSFSVDPHDQLRKCLDECQGTLNLKLVGLSIKKNQLPPLFRALNRQNNLQQLDLSDNNLLNEGIQELCFPLRSLIQLRSLNLSRNNLTGEGMRFLSEIFTKPGQSVLENLTDLNLSFNLFGDDTLRHLAVICQKLNLQVLNLSGCSFPENIFDNVYNHGVVLNLAHLEIFDLSFNDLNSEGVIKFISFLNFANISNLNVSHNTNVSVSGIVKCITENLSQHETNNIKSLNLSKCKVNDSEIWELLRILTKSQDLDSLQLSFNCDLTAVSLRRLLQHRPSFSCLNLLGCSNIIQYFEEFTLTTNPTNEMYHVNTLKNLTLSINCKNNSKEADFLVRLWEKEWGKRAKIRKIFDKKIQFLVED